MYTIRTKLLLPICAALFCIASHAFAQPSDSVSAKADSSAGLRAGGAWANITPTKSMPNYNGSTLVPDADASPLQVKAVVLDDGSTKVAIISVDCTFIGRIELQKMREALQAKHGLKPENICVAATHSHTSPATTASFLTGELPEPAYVDLLVEQTCKAVGDAVSRLKPARVVAASIDAPPIGVCRRRLDEKGQAYMTGTEPSRSLPAESEIDTKMQYAIFVDNAGEPLAAMFNFSCHNNMVNRNYSADMFGRAAEYLQEKLGQIAVVTLAAPCGDVGYRQAGGRRTYKDDRTAGNAIADAILASYSHQKPRDGTPLLVRSVVRQIPDRPYDPKTYIYDNGRGSGKSAHENFKERYGPEQIEVRKRGETTCDVEFQVIAFGDTAIVTNPAELFSIYGVKIREASPYAVTFVSSLTNGYCGYVPTSEAFQHGGYETYRTVNTSRLAKDGGDRIQQESIDLLKAVHNSAPGSAGGLNHQ